MLDIDMVEPIVRTQRIDQERDFYLSKLVNQWDDTIRQALNRFAVSLWPSRSIWGVLSRKVYRLRTQRLDPETHCWWVESDLPAADGGQCVAYCVKLFLGTLAQPVIIVQSGETTYPVASLTLEALEATLAQAGQDTPLMVLIE